LPADVLAALQQGQTIEAIKRLRMATGLGLKEAKDAIDRHLGGEAPRPRASIASMATLPFAVSAAMLQGNKLEAIRLLREQGGLGLREAKAAVEAFEHQQTASRPRSLAGRGPAHSGCRLVILIVVLAGWRCSPGSCSEVPAERRLDGQNAAILPSIEVMNRPDSDKVFAGSSRGSTRSTSFP
jgi:ribosomal protein L7/L12